jgi:hypothetical protein
MGALVLGRTIDNPQGKSFIKKMEFNSITYCQGALA